jgi:hypothetical protein
MKRDFKNLKQNEYNLEDSLGEILQILTPKQ